MHLKLFNCSVGRFQIEILIATSLNDAAHRQANAVRVSIANKLFSKFPIPHDQSWLDVVHRNGLLRYDPDPDGPLDDPMVITDDVVRFSFHRFQDHLMGESCHK